MSIKPVFGKINICLIIARQIYPQLRKVCTMGNLSFSPTPRFLFSIRHLVKARICQTMAQCSRRIWLLKTKKIFLKL